MKFLNILERKLGRFAIRNLMLYIVVFNFTVFLMGIAYKTVDVIGYLALIPELVVKGEVWRLITYIFIPPEFSPIFIIFALYFYYLIGSSLEHEWGSFKFNLYYFLGMLCTIAGTFISGIALPNYYLNLSLFLAFAYIFPNFEILILFIIPVKVKYLAALSWIFYLTALIAFSWSDKIAIIVSLINFFLFFGKDILMNVIYRRKSFFSKIKFHSKHDRTDAFHKCHSCGTTEKTEPGKEFRYCSDCEGDYEFCMEHLKNHAHVRKNQGK